MPRETPDSPPQVRQAPRFRQHPEGAAAWSKYLPSEKPKPTAEDLRNQERENLDHLVAIEKQRLSAEFVGHSYVEKLQTLTTKRKDLREEERVLSESLKMGGVSSEDQLFYQDFWRRHASPEAWEQSVKVRAKALDSLLEEMKNVS